MNLSSPLSSTTPSISSDDDRSITDSQSLSVPETAETTEIDDVQMMVTDCKTSTNCTTRYQISDGLESVLAVLSVTTPPISSDDDYSVNLNLTANAALNLFVTL